MSFISKTTVIILIIAASQLHCCSPVPYANVGQNVPLFHSKNEVAFSGSWSTTEDADGVGLQMAVAVDSTLAISSSFYSLRQVDDYLSSSTWEGNGRYFEIAAGNFNKFKINEKLIYEVFVGIGFARIENNLSDNTSNFNVNFCKPYIQPSIGYTSKIIDVAFTPRIAYVTYTNKDYHFNDTEQIGAANDFFKKNNSKLLFEPGLTLRAGYKGTKINFNYCTSTFRIKGNTDASPNNDFFSIGLNFLISKRFTDY